MRLFIAFTTLIVAISAASDQDLWVDFKNNHGKTYRSLREEKLRFNIFQEKLREIESHNARYEKGEVSYSFGVNQFSDLTADEFAALLNKNIASKPKFHTTPFKHELNANSTVPEEINWVEKGAVTEIKDQGSCGCCWAFSTTGSIEGQNAIINNKSVSLSEQELVDCLPKYGGCSGGYIENGLNYSEANGLTTESDYPYLGVAGTCKSVNSTLKISGYVDVEPNEKALKTAVGIVGPISAYVFSNWWQNYEQGVFDEPECPDIKNHAILVVGYGYADGKNYWLIKNSWGKSWGEDGYIRLARDQNCLCGIASLGAFYPKL